MKFPVLLLAVWLCGVAVASIFSADNLMFWISVVVLIYLLWKFAGALSGKQKIILLGVFCLGILRFFAALLIWQDSYLLNLETKDQIIMFSGKIINQPDRREDGDNLLIKTQWLQMANSSPRELMEVVKIKAAKYPILNFGDEIVFEGKIAEMNQEYQQIMAKDGVAVVLWNFKILKILEADWDWQNLLVKGILNFKFVLLKKINEVFPEPAAGIAAGILIGERSSIDQSLLNDFSKVGLTHILAVSGYNITLIINLLICVMQGQSKSLRTLVTIVMIVFFVILTGAAPSVLRAGLMGIILVLVKFLQRRPKVINTLLLSAVIMVMANPWILNFDISFQLSFGATFGLVLLMPNFEKSAEHWPDFLKENLLVTLAAQLFTIPIMLYYFGKMSIISPVANVLVLPLMPLMMLFAFVGLLSGFVSQILSWPFVAFLNFLVWLMEIIVKILAKLPLAEINFSGIAVWIFALYFVLLIIAFGKPKSVRN